MMKHMMIVLLLICSGISHTVHAALSQDELNQLNQPKNDLDSTHLLITTSLSTLKDAIQNFPEAQKSDLLSQIKSAQTQIDSYYNNAVKRLQTETTQAQADINSKSGVSREIALASVVSDLSDIANPAKINMEIAFGQINNSVTQVAQQLGLTQALQKAQEAQQKQAQYHQRVLKLLSDLQPVINSFSNQSDAIRDAIIKQVQSGSVNETTVATITNNSEALLKQANQVYNNNKFPILASDTSNYVVASFSQLNQYYTDEMAIAVDQANALLTDPRKIETAFAPLAQLGLRILGTTNSLLSDAVKRLPSSMTNVKTDIFKQGYNTTVQNLANTYFGKQASSVMQEYRNTKEKVTFNIFVNALQQLTNTYSEPTAEQVGYAIIYYNVIIDDFDVLTKELTTRWQTQIAVALAVFYASRGQTVLKSMQPGKDNSALLQDAIDSYNQASNYYATAGGDQNLGLAKTYGSISSSLATAQKTFQQGIVQEKANNIDNAINSYQQAAAEFKQAGDAVDATQANFNLQRLNANQKQKDGQKALNDYLTKHTSNFIEYMSFISTSSGQTVEDFDTYASLYTDLQEAVSSAMQLYSVAKSALEALSSTQIGQGASQDASKQLAIINNSISWLTSMNTALQALSNGDETLREVPQAGSTDAMFNTINTAEGLYSKALNSFSDADALFNEYPSIQQDVIVLPNILAQTNTTLSASLTKNQTWTWSTVAYRHIATLYITVAAKVTTNSIVDMQCYSNANMRNRLLSPGMISFLQATIQSLKEQKSNVDKLFQQAQENEKKALAATADDWQPDPKATTYISKANSLWQSTLNTYAHAYNLGNVQAKDAFVNAVNEYEKAYKTANIPAQFYPDLGQAFIEYNKYILYISENDTQNSNQVLSTIKPLIGGIFDTGNSLEQSVSSVLQQNGSLDTLMSASGKQEQLVAWQERIEQAINDQQTIINTLAPSADATKLVLITKTIDQKSGATMYSFGLGNKSVTLADPIVTLAQLNAQIGATAYKQKDYITAYDGYNIAKKLYEDQGMSSQASALSTQFNLSRTLATAQQFRDFILPNKKETHNIPSITVANISVPQQHELKVYQQAYPLSVPAGFDTLAAGTTEAQKQQLQNQLLGMAAILYLYNILKANGLDITEVIDLDTMSPKKGISASNLKVVQDAVAQTKEFQSDLQDRITKKTSSLYVIKQNGTYYVGEVYKPIPSIPPTDEQGNSTLPYITYPYATYYYIGAYDLFKPGTNNVNIGGNLYVPGNDTQEAKEVLALIANAYLSAAATNKADMDATDSAVSKALNAVKAVKPGDASVSLTDYMDKYTYVKNYYLNLILLQYDTAYKYYSQYLNNTQYANNLVSLLADTYTTLADKLSIFLIGNPLDSDYSTTALPDIENYYKTAVNYYNNPVKTKALYEKIGQLYSNAGQQIVKQGDFIYALGFLYRAEQTYQNIPQPDAQTKQLLESATLVKLQTMFKGSTQKLQDFADKRYAGQAYPNSTEKRPLITLTLSTGEKKQETFEQLQQKYQTAGTGDIDQTGVDSAELKEYSAIKSEILDGLIFYSACSTSAANELPAQSQKQTTTPAPPDPIAQAALDLINSYTKDNEISLGSLDDITRLLESKDFSEQVNGFFDQCYQKIQKAGSDQDKYIGFSGIMQWANKLYFAFAQVYMHDYLGGEVGADQWADFTEAIKSEEQEIQAPSSLYT